MYSLRNTCSRCCFTTNFHFQLDINLAVLGGNDPHSYGVTSRRASMNTLGPIFIVKHRGRQFRRWGASQSKPMQLCQDPSPAAWARIAYASIRDTLSVLNYKNKIGGDGWIRTTALFRGQIYSLVQSTTLPRLQKRVRARLQSLVSHYWEKCSGDMPLQNILYR